MAKGVGSPKSQNEIPATSTRSLPLSKRKLKFANKQFASSSLVSSSKSPQLWSSAKITFWVAAMTTASLLFLHHFKMFPDLASFNSRETVSVIGGWRVPSEEVMQRYWSEICTIERICVDDLSLKRFESEVRFRKPVLVSFPSGAKGWTAPDKWSKEELVKAYSRRTIHSGQSLQIVRKGGNADYATSFISFVEDLLPSQKNGSLEPEHYAFDRQFYWQSELPQTLHMPKYFEVNVLEDESIFFLGASMTGVVFHKHSDTWNGVVYGHKRWFLYPNTRTPPGGVHHGFSLLEWVTKIYTNLTDEEKPMECIQKPGEILYLPEGTYHATLNLGDTIAVAIQKREPITEAEQLSYEANDLVNYLQRQRNADPNHLLHIRLKLLEIYERWLELLPENSEAVMKIGDTLYELEEYAESLPWHMRAIKMDPYFVLAYVHLAKTFAKLGQYNRAEITFKEALKLSPNLWDTYKEYGEFLLEQGRHAEALPVYKKGTELMPDMVPFWFYYKHCQVQSGDYEGAEETEKIMVNLKSRLELNGHQH